MSLLDERSPDVLRLRGWLESCGRTAVLAGALSLPAAAASAAAPEPTPPAGGVSSGAHADDFLVWQAPVGCSTAAAVRERVRELLGEPELDLRHVERVVGRVTEATNGWTLHLTLVDALGRRERTLASDQCQDLAEAAAVAISLAFEAARDSVESSAARAQPADEPAADSSPAAELAAAKEKDAAAVAVEPVDTGSDARDPALAPTATAIGAELLVDVSSLPVVAPGVALFGGLRWSELRLAVFVAWLPGADKSVGPDQSVSFSLFTGGLRACYALGHGLVDTALCAGGELGQLSASGSGLFRAQNVHDLWLAPQLGLELNAPIERSFGLHVRADAIFPVLRRGYAINETDDFHRTSSVALRAAAGAWVAF